MFFLPTTLYRPRTKRAFTLIEVLVTIAISSILFLAISNMMVSFFQINTSLRKEVELNSQKEITHLTLRNFLNEAERIEWLDPTAMATKQRIILRNNAKSSLLPYTAIDLENDKLTIRNFAVATSDGSSPISTAPAKTLQNTNRGSTYYFLDYEHNAVYWSNTSTFPNPLPDHYCADPDTTDLPCTLVGFKSASLAYDSSAFAPFIQILKPTDMRFSPSDNKLYILSPYEEREYAVHLNQLKITATDKAAGKYFPYFYNGSNQVTSVTFSAWPSFAVDFPTVQTGGKFAVKALQVQKDVYQPAVPPTSQEIIQLIYSLADTLTSTVENKAFVVKVLKK